MSDDDDLPDGVYYDDETPTVRCPRCRAEIAEDSLRCPKCENYLSIEDAPGEPRSIFWLVMMGLALLCAAWWLL